MILFAGFLKEEYIEFVYCEYRIFHTEFLWKMFFAANWREENYGKDLFISYIILLCEWNDINGIDSKD